MHKLKLQQGRTYPPVTDIVKYINNANDDKNPDIRDLMAVCKISKTKNLRLRGHIKVRKTAVTSFGWRITNKLTKEIDTDAQEALSRTIRRILDKHVTTPLFGCFAVKFEWSNDIIKKPIALKFIDPTRMRQEENGITIIDDNNKIETQLSFDEFVPDFIFDCDDDNEEKGGLLAAIALIDALRWEMRAENANTLTLMKGILQIINQGAPEGDDEQNAIEAFRQARQYKGFVSNDLIDSKLHQVISGDLSAFGQLIKEINDEIAIAVLGQANTSQLPENGGSRAAVEVLKLISADIHYDDMTRCTHMINDLLLKYYHVNVDSSVTDNCPLEFEFKYEEENNTTQNADTAVTLLSAGIPLKKSEIYGKTGFTEPTDQNDIFNPVNAGV